MHYLLDLQVQQGHVTLDRAIFMKWNTREEANGFRANPSSGGGSQMCLNMKKKLSCRKLRGTEPNHIWLMMCSVYHATLTPTIRYRRRSGLSVLFRLWEEENIRKKPLLCRQVIYGPDETGFTVGNRICKLGRRWCVDRSRLALFGELGIRGGKLKQTFKTPGAFQQSFDKPSLTRCHCRWCSFSLKMLFSQGAHFPVCTAIIVSA